MQIREKLEDDVLHKCLSTESVGLGDFIAYCTSASLKQKSDNSGVYLRMTLLTRDQKPVIARAFNEVKEDMCIDDLESNFLILRGEMDSYGFRVDRVTLLENPPESLYLIFLNNNSKYLEYSPQISMDKEFDRKILMTVSGKVNKDAVFKEFSSLVKSWLVFSRKGLAILQADEASEEEQLVFYISAAMMSKGLELMEVHISAVEYSSTIMGLATNSLEKSRAKNLVEQAVEIVDAIRNDREQDSKAFRVIRYLLS